MTVPHYALVWYNRAVKQRHYAPTFMVNLYLPTRSISNLHIRQISVIHILKTVADVGGTTYRGITASTTSKALSTSPKGLSTSLKCHSVNLIHLCYMVSDW